MARRRRSRSISRHARYNPFYDKKGRKHRDDGKFTRGPVRRPRKGARKAAHKRRSSSHRVSRLRNSKGQFKRGHGKVRKSRKRKSRSLTHRAHKGGRKARRSHRRSSRKAAKRRSRRGGKKAKRRSSHTAVMGRMEKMELMPGYGHRRGKKTTKYLPSVYKTHKGY